MPAAALKKADLEDMLAFVAEHSGLGERLSSAEPTAADKEEAAAAAEKELAAAKAGVLSTFKEFEAVVLKSKMPSIVAARLTSSEVTPSGWRWVW